MEAQRGLQTTLGHTAGKVVVSTQQPKSGWMSALMAEVPGCWDSEGFLIQAEGSNKASS